MGKNIGALSQEPTDKWLELSLGVNRSWGFDDLNKSCSIKKDFETGLALALSPSFASHKMRKAMENPEHCVTVYKRKRVELETKTLPMRVPDQLRIGPSHDP
ncbi:hypothetical protein V6N13_026343 [Hibiscus sabdariffa]